MQNQKRGTTVAATKNNSTNEMELLNVRNARHTYPGTAEICGYPVPTIISGTGKATNFKFCTHTISHKKSPLKILGKVAVGIDRTPSGGAYVTNLGSRKNFVLIFTARQHSSSYAKRCISYDRFCLSDRLTV